METYTQLMMKLLRAFALMTLLCGYAQAQTTIHPGFSNGEGGDTYARGGSWKTTNFGGDPEMAVANSNQAKNRKHAYLQFDLSGISGTITSATLTLSATSVAGLVTNNLYEAEDNYNDGTGPWLESVLHWNNKPDAGALITNWTLDPASGSAPFTVAIDVLTEDQAVTDGRFSVRVSGVEDDVEVLYATKENSNTSLWPVLEVETSGGNQSPTVSITAPADGAVYQDGDDITITADASDSDGTIDNVEFFEDGNTLQVVSTSPYTYTWIDPPVGTHVLTAVATDDAQATTTSSAITVRVNEAPSVSFTAPANGASFTDGDVITLTADASDNDGTIANVEFLEDGNSLQIVSSAPYTYDWSGAPVATHVLTAVATDNDGATTSVDITISVDPANGAPTVSITAPTGGASYTEGDNVTITADATDSDGSIASVEFFEDGTSLQVISTAPYTYTWINPPLGTHVLTAVATDDAGATTTSSDITIDVNQQPGSGNIVSLTPIDDAYARAGTHSSTPFGTLVDHLQIRQSNQGKNRHQGYLKFDLNGVSGSILSAQLKLVAYRADATVTHDLNLADDELDSDPPVAWTDENLIWSTRPSVVQPALDSWTLTTNAELDDTDNQEIVVSVLDQVNNAIADDGYLSFRISAQESDIQALYGASDTTLRSIQPVLEIVVDVGETERLGLVFHVLPLALLAHCSVLWVKV